MTPERITQSLIKIGIPYEVLRKQAGLFFMLTLLNFNELIINILTKYFFELC
jgi:hypothetical protein